MRAAAGTLGLLCLASCAGDPAHPSLTGAPVLFEATARATNAYTCDGARWQLREKGQEVVFGEGGRRIGTATGDSYSTTWRGDDGSAVTAQVAAREGSGDNYDPPVLIYSAIGHQGAGRFSPVASVRRGRPSGIGLLTVACKEVGEERKVSYSVVYTYYGAAK